MTYRNHRGVHERNAGTAPEGVQSEEEHQGKEHPTLKLYETVVGYGRREIRLPVLLDIEQIEMLEVVEVAQMEHQKDGHDFTVGHRGLTIASWSR